MTTPDATPVSVSEHLRVALVQVESPDEETPAERITRVEELLRAHADVDFFVLPELWSPGYFSFEEYEARAEALDGPTIRMCRSVARDLGATVHAGSIIERDTEGKLHNTAVMIDPTGKIAQVYRKIHVFGYESLESQLLTPGTTLSVVGSSAGALASTTCYDLRFPGLWQELSERGAETVVVPAAWPAARREHWRILTEARAVEHQVWVFACNAGGVQRGVELGGYSRIVDPSGRVLVECGAGEEIAIIDIEPALTSRVRQDFPAIADRLTNYANLSPASGAEATHN